MRKIKIAATLVFASLFAFACSQSAPNLAVNSNAKPSANTAAATPQPAATKDEVAIAKELYSTNCAACHKESGKGGKVTVEGKALDADDLTGDRMKTKADEKLFQYILDGVPDEGMPAFKGKLTDDQIRSVVKHLRSLQKS